MTEQDREERLTVLQLEMALEVERQRLLDLDSESEAEAAAARPPRPWVKPWLLRRGDHGAYDHLMVELEAEDPTEFKRLLRVDPPMFQELVDTLTPIIQKQPTVMREALPVGLRLAVTLKFMCSGESYPEIAHLFRISTSSICNIISETCDAIHAHYGDELLMPPDEPQKWKQAAARFEDKWQLPHCVGALDGKHIAIKKPGKSGSTFHNYKGFFSILLMAMVDADYKFQWVTVGAAGACSDAQIWNRCDLKRHILQGRIGWPEGEPLAGQAEVSQYFIAADEAFALQTWLQKPFPRRGLSPEQLIYNYRLSRARRVVENAFGILAKRFQCLLTTMQLQPKKVEKVVLATTCLHNIMRMRYPEDQNRDLVALEEGAAQNPLQLFGVEPHASQGRLIAAAKHQRDLMMRYVNSPEGSVSWQNRRAGVDV